MPRYNVEITLSPSTLEIETIDEEDAKWKAIDKCSGMLEVDSIELIEEENQETENQDGLDLEIKGGALVNSSHTILCCKILSDYFKSKFEKTKKIKNPKKIFKEIEKFSEDLYSLFSIGYSTFSPILLREALDLLSGLNGNETIKMFAGIDTILFIQIDDEWLLVAPKVEEPTEY